MIEFVNVTKSYNNLTALDNVSFEIAKDEFVFLVGPSGSGKTTIIKLLIKQEAPTSGNIYFYDTDITTLTGAKVTQLRREIGVVFQDFKLLPQKNLYENIAFALEVSGKRNEDIQETVEYVLDLIGLKERRDAFPDELSGGEKQKVAIARAVANNPKVLIADEPTGNLDPASSREILTLLSKINEWGTTVIMATHGSDIVEQLNKRVIQLDHGKIVSDSLSGVYPSEVAKKELPTELEEKIIHIEQQDEIKEETEDADNEPEEIAEVDVLQKEGDKSEEDANNRTDSSEEVNMEEQEKSEQDTQEAEEKEFEITFTTKQRVPLSTLTKQTTKSDSTKKKNSKKQKKKKSAARDIVDIHKLDLQPKIEEALINADIKTIETLKKQSKSQLKKIPKIGTKTAAEILKKLEKIS